VKDKDLHTYGFLGYPSLQAADITIYSKEGMTLVVPTGEDQVSHVETTREIVRRFNLFYGQQILEDELVNKKKRPIAIELYGLLFPGENKPNEIAPETAKKMVETMRRAILEGGLANFVEKFVGQHAYFSNFVQTKEVLTEPSVMLTKTPRIPGLDGRKMSKSYGNTITLSESDADIRAKTKVMVTDPARKRRSDPGNPDVCPVYDWHKLFSPQETLDWSAQGCRTAGIGCIECKAAMADNLIKWIAPIRERRLEYEKHPARVLEVIDAGSKKARAEAQQTMTRVREAVFGWEKKRKEVASGE
jgi:tryptophanyl-tRNA synthetase